ncbi:uncharacterized protein KRP23_4843 [Phytophthora ramorum]|uniref:uncharacterized protein n=1 Tax=Phytophthora ramorum TaxID=164328 RepID=UPI0030A34A76|nr:hypothetical protein KRP23_4843 [Phytophthora ramorum]
MVFLSPTRESFYVATNIQHFGHFASLVWASPSRAHSAFCHVQRKRLEPPPAMRNLFHRSDKRQSSGSDDGVEIKERRSSIFRRHRDVEEIVELMRPRDTLVSRISDSSESPKELRRRRRRSLL